MQKSADERLTRPLLGRFLPTFYRFFGLSWDTFGAHVGHVGDTFGTRLGCIWTALCCGLLDCLMLSSENC